MKPRFFGLSARQITPRGEYTGKLQDTAKVCTGLETGMTRGRARYTARIRKAVMNAIKTELGTSGKLGMHGVRRASAVS
jgi:hypothetical protein